VHIPDGFLGAGVAASTWVAAGGAVAAALRVEKRERVPMPAGILGSVSAFLFAAQMINVPVAPGTSGHLVGATLAAALLGPWRGLLAMTAVLAVQALLFQDGGIAAFGANLVDMGVAGVFVGYAVTYAVARAVRGPRGQAAGAVVGAFVATLAGAVLVALWLSLSGLYPWSGILPPLLVAHVAIGLLEAALTGAILVTVLKWRPDLVAGLGGGQTVQRPAALAVGVLGVAMLVAAAVSPFASVLPDGLEHVAATLGFAGRAHASWASPMPQYAVPWLRSAVLAPVVAGLAGTVAAAALAWTISRTLSARGTAAALEEDVAPR
jgi:cobalt/nickel transport system permease protein